MIELKDVIHFYLGVEVKVIKSNYYLVHNHSIHVGDTIELNTQNLHALSDALEACDFKPILRKLSDMTNEEKEQIGFKACQVLREKGVFPKFQEGKVWAAYQTMYLLKRGFDLFGLIESGQAIDASTENK